MVIYACGGAGTAIASQVASSCKPQNGFCDMTFNYIDTSKADLSSSIKKENCYIFQNMDGSGSFRAQNYPDIEKRIPEIIHTFPAGDVNVVIHSGAGGSGSVIGPLLVKSLKEKGKVVIVLLIGSKASRIAAKNTVNTFYTYANFAENLDSPVSVYYRLNSKETPQSKVDASMATTIVLLSALFSGCNRKLDSADLKNFVDYSKVTGHQPGLAALEITYGKPYEETENTLVPATLALGTDGQDLSSDSKVDYHTYGYLSEEQAKSMAVDAPVYFTQVLGLINSSIKELNDWVKASEEMKTISMNRMNTLVPEKGTTSSGMVL